MDTVELLIYNRLLEVTDNPFMAQTVRGDQWLVWWLDYCYPVLQLGIGNSCLSSKSLVRKNSDPNQVMFCKGSGQLATS